MTLIPLSLLPRGRKYLRPPKKSVERIVGPSASGRDRYPGPRFVCFQVEWDGVRKNESGQFISYKARQRETT